MKKSLSLLALAFLAACAAAPDAIAPAAISPDLYAGRSCQQLAQENANLTAELTTLVAQQQRAVDGDAMGVFLLGLPMSSMSGNDKETEIALARGKQQAITLQMQTKGCRAI
ncbi:MAG: hypothetical protein COB08_010065 [Rhodobacteraceae bacterium]|nr:hypothetical protein [Paracoccaceae bacterium]